MVAKPKQPMAAKLEPLSLKISKEDLISRLKALSGHLSERQQDEDTSDLHTFTTTLVQSGFLAHRDKAVKMWVCICLSDILRIYAPDAPYSAVQLKKIFQAFVSQLQYTAQIKNPAFSRYFYLLENLADVKAFVMCIDIDAHSVIGSLFSTLFDSVREDHSRKVIGCMQAILQDIIENADHVSEEILDVIFHQLVSKSASPAATLLATSLLRSTANTIQSHVHSFFNGLFGFGQSSASDLVDHAFDLVEKVCRIDPNILLTVLPLLAQQMKLEDVDRRRDAAQTVGNIFADGEQGASLISRLRTLWVAFLGRAVDKEPVVRLTVLNFFPQIFKNCVSTGTAEDAGIVVADLLDKLSECILDEDEKVRQTAIKAAFGILDVRHGVVPQSLWNTIMGRAKDKKASVRQIVFQRSAKLYDRIASNYDDGALFSVEEQIFTNIPRVLLTTLGIRDADIRFQVYKAFHDLILKSSLTPSQRSLRVLRVFATLQPGTERQVFVAFVHLSKQVRDSIVKEVENSSSLDDANIQNFVSSFSNLLPSSMMSIATGREALSQFVSCRENQVIRDVHDSLSTCIPYTEVTAARERVLARFKQKSVAAHDAAAVLLYRGSPMPIDGEALEHLLSVLQRPDDCDWEDVTNLIPHAVEFLRLYAAKSPESFLGNDVLDAISCLLQQREQFADLALSMLLLVPTMPDSLGGARKRLINMASGGGAGSSEDAIAQSALAVRVIIKKFGVDSAPLKTVFRSAVAVLEDAHTQLAAGEGEDVIHALSALRVIASEATSLLEANSSKVIAELIVKGLIMKHAVPAPADEPDDADEWAEVISTECRAKLIAIDLLVQRVLGLLRRARVPAAADSVTNNTQSTASEKTKRSARGKKSATKVNTAPPATPPNPIPDASADIEVVALPTIRMLLSFVENNGIITAAMNAYDESDRPSAPECSRLRLAAVCGLLELCSVAVFRNIVTQSPENFQTIAFMMQDSCDEVRKLFANKLSTMLIQQQLPINYMVVLVLGAADPNPTLCRSSQRQLEQYVKHLRESKPTTKQNGTLAIPEQGLPYLVHLLAHHPDFTVGTYNPPAVGHGLTESEIEALRESEDYLNRFFDAVCTRGSESFSFLKTTVNYIRRLVDMQGTSSGMHVLCELAELMLLKRMKKSGWRLVDQGKPRVPTSLMRAAGDVSMTRILPPSYKLTSKHAMHGAHSVPAKGALMDDSLVSTTSSPNVHRKIGAGVPVSTSTPGGNASPARKRRSAGGSATKSRGKKHKEPVPERAPTRVNARRSAKSAVASFREDSSSEVEDGDEDDDVEMDARSIGSVAIDSSPWKPALNRSILSPKTDNSAMQPRTLSELTNTSTSKLNTATRALMRKRKSTTSDISAPKTDSASDGPTEDLHSSQKRKVDSHAEVSNSSITDTSAASSSTFSPVVHNRHRRAAPAQSRSTSKARKPTLASTSPHSSESGATKSISTKRLTPAAQPNDVSTTAKGGKKVSSRPVVIRRGGRRSALRT